jgi:hypothetical protein
MVAAYFVFHIAAGRPAATGLAIVGRPTIVAGRLVITLTNGTDRPLPYRVSDPLLKLYGAWQNGGPAEYISIGSNQPLIPIAPEILPARRGIAVAVNAPRYITAPLGARAWRVAVILGQLPPTKVQLATEPFLNQVRSILGLTVRVKAASRTEYSPEFAL